jgi:sporulation protein YlmC with PRC-barrel domain
MSLLADSAFMLVLRRSGAFMMGNNVGTMVKLGETGRTIARGEDIRHRRVKDLRNGEVLGRVEDLLIAEAEEEVRFLVVASRAALGVDANTLFIPISAIQVISTKSVYVDISRSSTRNNDIYNPRLIEDCNIFRTAYYG